MDDWLKTVYEEARKQNKRFEISRDIFCEWINAYWDGETPEAHVKKWGITR